MKMASLTPCNANGPALANGGARTSARRRFSPVAAAAAARPQVHAARRSCCCSCRRESMAHFSNGGSRRNHAVASFAAAQQQPAGVDDSAAAAAGQSESSPPPLFEATLPCGALTVRPLTEADVRGAALLMTRAFAGTPEAVGMDEAADFLRTQLAKPALGLTLVARLAPNDPSLLAKGATSRVAGTACVAWDLQDAAARDGLARLASLPPGGCYLSNMAVDPKLRRQGVARALLAAADKAAGMGPAAFGGAGGAAGGSSSSSSGSSGACDTIWLHVRDGDAPAGALYAGAGFTEVEREAPSGGGGLLGFSFGGGGGGAQRRPRVLMRRAVQGGR